MHISRMTVDKLGVKLYDRVYAVISELIANSYDADATEVIIKAPMGQFLATKQDGIVTSKSVSIIVEDNGNGMSPQELQDFYLVVGSERRTDPKRGSKSKKFARAVMGRKGIGKLAPFGVCKKVEVISAGGEKITRNGEEGYLTAHIILDKEQIISDTSDSYNPGTGAKDDTLSASPFTKIVLEDFYYRRIAELSELSRQLSQRFGLESPNWRITLIDSTKTSGSPDYSMVVGKLDIPVMDASKLIFNGPLPTLSTKEDGLYTVNGPDGTKLADLSAGFWCDGLFYPVKGWVAYAKEPYKDELMAGIRIYCRGKFAAQTTVFNRKAGFTGEHSVRSYLVGELHADWLDEDEDLIQTDRRDILWSQELGTEFQNWGQKIVQQVGQISRDPMRKKMEERFFEAGKVPEKVDEKFPGNNQKDLRDTAINIAKQLGKSLRGDEIEDAGAVNDLVELSMLLAPIKSLDDKLREASTTPIPPLRMINSILKTAKVAETVTFGHQVQKRIQIIDRLESLKDQAETEEAELQELIEAAPWLINPQWITITANQSLTTLKRELEKYYKEKTGQDIYLISFTESRKRPDFVCFSQDSVLQIIEIKKPKHIIDNTEWDRIQTYCDQLTFFLADHQHAEFNDIFLRFHVTLVCDGVRLSGAQKKAYDSYLKDGDFTMISWSTFLLRTRKVHEEFLNEAERLKALV